MGLLSRGRLYCELRVLGLEFVGDSMLSAIRPSRGRNRPRLVVEPLWLSDCPSGAPLRFELLFDRRRRGGDSSTSVHSDEDVLPCSWPALLLFDRWGLTPSSNTSIGLDTTSLGATRADKSGYDEHMAGISLLQYVLHESNPDCKRSSHLPWCQCSARWSVSAKVTR